MDESILPEVLWLIDQADDLQTRIDLLSKLANWKQNELVVRAWLKLIGEFPGWKTVMMAVDQGVCFSALPVEEQKELAAYLVNVAPQPFSKEVLNGLIRLLQSSRSPIMIEMSQDLLDGALDLLLEEDAEVWNQMYPFLSNDLKSRHFPNYLNLIKTFPKFCNWLKRYIRLNTSEPLKEQNFVKSVNYFLENRRYLDHVQLGQLMGLILDKEATFTIASLLEVLPEALPHMHANKNLWRLLDLEPSLARRLELILVAFGHGVFSADDERLKATFLDLCQKLAETNPVWSAIFRARNLGLTLSSEEVSDFCSILPAPVSWEDFESFISLCKVCVHEGLRKRLVVRMLEWLDQELVNGNLMLIQEKVEQIGPYLDNAQKLVLNPELTRRLAKEKRHGPAQVWWKSCLVLDWPEEKRASLLSLASELIELALEMKEIETAAWMAQHNKIAAQMAPETILRILTSHLSIKQFHCLALLLFARDECSEHEVSECLSALLSSDSSEALGLCLELLQLKNSRSLTIWKTLWIGLFKQQELDLVQKAYGIFQAIDWKGMEVINLWSYMISALCVVDAKEILDLVPKLEGLEGSVEAKQPLWQQYFRGSLSYAIKNNDPKIVDQATKDFQALRKEAIKDPITVCAILTFLVQAGFTLNMQRQFPSLLKFVTYCYRVFPTLPDELKGYYRNMLASIAECKDLTVTQVMDLVNLVNCSERLGEWLSSIQLLSRCENAQCFELVLKRLTELVSKTPEQFDEWDRQAYLSTLEAISKSAHPLPMLAIQGLQNHAKCLKFHEAREPFMRFYVREGSSMGVLNAASLLAYTLNTDEPVDPVLAMLICDQVETLAPDLRTRSEYNNILLSPRIYEFMGNEERRTRLLRIASRAFIVAFESMNAVAIEAILEWGLEALEDYLGRPENRQLTEQFIKLMLAGEETKSSISNPVFLHKQKTGNSLEGLLAKLFDLVRRKGNPKIVSIFENDVRQISAKSDFSLVLQTVSLLVDDMAKYAKDRGGSGEWLARFFTLLAKVPSSILETHIDTLQPLVAKTIVTLHVIFEGKAGRDQGCALWKLWKSRLGKYEVVVAMALFDPLPPKYEGCTMEQIHRTCSYLTAIPGSFGLRRAMVLVGAKTEAIMCYKKKPHSLIAPMILHFLEIARQHPEYRFKIGDFELSMADMMASLLFNYIQKARKYPTHFASGQKIFCSYLETLIRDLVSNMKSGSFSPVATACARLADCTSLLTSSVAAGWTPEIIPSYSHLIKQIMVGIVPFLPAAASAKLDREFQNNCEAQFSLLKESEKGPVIQAIHATMEAQLKPEEISRVKELLVNILDK